MIFKDFTKIARLSREVVITEKIDGTNGRICNVPIAKGYHDDKMLGYWYGPDASTWAMYAGSRTRWITPSDDNYGFAKWALANFEDLKNLGPGAHFGEWWGQGIQRKYGLTEKRFSLFNAAKWGESRPACCNVVPVLFRGPFETQFVDGTLKALAERGSVAAPGFMKPEGIVIFHSAARTLFKKTLEKDESPKGVTQEEL